jgi:hypothetical protein
MRPRTPQPSLHDERSAREFLLDEVLAFVGRARICPGVRRIAMVGSLLTDNPGPKDADVMVSVDAGADLVSLARAGRGLKGRAQQCNLGADIFLCDPDGRYVGRICKYKECAPGIRVSCRADWCGRRPHLCDDLHDLTLPAAVTVTPMLELWPAVVRRGAIPADVEERVVGRLIGGG